MSGAAHSPAKKPVSIPAAGNSVSKNGVRTTESFPYRAAKNKPPTPNRPTRRIPNPPLPTGFSPVRRCKFSACPILPAHRSPKPPRAYRRRRTSAPPAYRRLGVCPPRHRNGSLANDPPYQWSPPADTEIGRRPTNRTKPPATPPFSDGRKNVQP